MKRVLTAVVLTCMMTGAARAQQATDIFVADVVLKGDVLHIGSPRNVTQRDGYDNQPWFVRDGSGFLYSSERGGQTDIFRYDLQRGESVRITSTPENEYSPSLPLDGSRLMVVRWPADMSTGALWWFTPDGAPIEQARGSVPRVGYYAFANDTLLALFINDSVQSFVIANTRTGEHVRIGERMNGSAPRAIPGAEAVSFQRRGEDGEWWLLRYDVHTRQASPLVRMIGGVPNYTWTPRGTVLAAVGNTIYEWAPGGSEWRAVVVFEDAALQNMSRLAVSPAGDRIAIVAAR
jgi:Tol biopolymer transport system component